MHKLYGNRGMASDKYREIIISDNVTILSSLFTYFDFDL